MSKNAKAAAVTAAYSRRAAAVEALEKIKTILSSKQLPELSEEAVRAARVQLEDSLARRALGEATDAEVERCRSALDATEREYAAGQKVHFAASAELGGLHRRLVASEEAAAAAERAVVEAEVEWILEEMRVAEEEYIRLGQSLRSQYERVLSCGDALRERDREHRAARYADRSAALMIPAIGEESCKLVSEMTNGRESVGGFLFNAPQYGWRKVDRSAMKDEIEALGGRRATGVARIGKIVGDLVGKGLASAT